MKLSYTPQARADLREIQGYIADHLQNPTAAKHITTMVLKSAGHLTDFPRLGFSVSEKTGRETDARCLFSGNYGIFYIVDEESILVLRILDARTDYMKCVFEESTEEQDTRL